MNASFRSTLQIFVAISAAFAYYALAVIYCWWPFSGLSLEQRGQLGDTFGAFTSLFSALGFGGVLLTLWHQRESNEDSRRRLELQGFETILFQLLASHNSIISELDIQKDHGGPVLARGRDCFHRYYTRHLKPAYKRLRNASPNSGEMTLALAAWESVWLRHRHNLGHYLRFIYNIFRYVDEAQIPEDAKRKYSRIIRSQLSDYELLLLFYNCLHQNGIERFKPLVEKYALFNNLPRELLLADAHVAFYSATAFVLPGTSDA